MSADDASKASKYIEKTAREITALETQEQVIHDKGAIRTKRQKLAIWLGVVQVPSYLCLCAPLIIHHTITYCSINIGMILVYLLLAVAVLGHIMLIFTAIRKVHAGTLLIPMSVQISMTAIALVQLSLMLTIFVRVGTDAFHKEVCSKNVKKQVLREVTDESRKTLCYVGFGLCLLSLIAGIAGFATNFLLYVELRKEQKDEEKRQNQVLEVRQRHRLKNLHDMILLQGKRDAEAANEGIKTAKSDKVTAGQEGAAPEGAPPDDGTLPKSAKSKHRMI